MAAKGANDGLWDWDLSTKTPFVSMPWKTMLGIGENEEIDMNGLWENLLHPDDKEKTISKFAEFTDGKADSYNEVFRLRHRDGSYRWIRSYATSIKDKKGNVVRVSGSHTDITEKKIAEDKLLESREKYRSLFQNSLVGMFRTNLETGHIIEANDKIWEMLEQEPTTDSSTFDFYKDPTDRERLIEALSKHGIVENMEVEIIKKNGKHLWVSINSKIYPKDNVIETIVVDITDTKNILLELQKVNFELDNFVYHASHDLRSPLSSILGLLNIYKQEKNPSIQADCIYRIEDSVKRLDHLVRELLAISRNDRVDDVHEKMNFMVEINSSIDSYFSGMKTDMLDIHVRVKQPTDFASDPTRIRIILNNLISNAIKYRDHDKPMSTIEIDINVDKNFAKIKVADNGLGIDNEKIKNIFNMFYRAHEDSDGSGLGLYIVKNVVEKLNGKIEVESKSTKGTIFSVQIPNTINRLTKK